jgi:hypothetical protein
VLFFLCLYLNISIAETSRADLAEYERLSGEIEKMSKHNVWKGVDKRFEEMETLNVDISFENYLLGAQAAQEIGDMDSCKKRLSNAIKISKKKQVVRWYQDIDENYSYVSLHTTSKNGRYLSIGSTIQGPVEGQAIAYATEVITHKGEFTGLLPVGEYEFSGQKFRVTPGLAVHMEVSPRLRKKTNITYEVVNKE